MMKNVLFILVIPFLLFACMSSGDVIKSQQYRVPGEKETGVTFHAQGNDITAIIVTPEGFLAASGAGISRWTFKNGMFAVSRIYTTSDGLPSTTCSQLITDYSGGVWAACAGGVAYMPKGTDRWECYTTQNCLPSGLINHLALSPAGDRIWVGTRNGLATTRVKQRRWQVFRRVKNPDDQNSYLNGNDILNIFPHPDKEIVWCRVRVYSECSCGQNVRISEFSLKSGEWNDIPSTTLCPHVSVHKVHFSKEQELLWFLRGYEPPMVYSYVNKKTRTWPTEPLWETVNREEGENLVEYSEEFGDMTPAKDGSGNMWFATSAGLWLYKPKQDKWEPHLGYKADRCGASLLAMNEKDDRIVWVCEDTIAVYETTTGKWQRLYGKERKNDDEEKEWEEEVEPVAPLQFAFTPGEKYLWCRCEECIMLSDLKAGTSIRLDVKSAPGLDAPRQVVFDTKKKLALVATPQGIVVSDFAGKSLELLKNDRYPPTGEVARFIFAPDGSEVWALLKDNLGGTDKAAVYDTKKQKWSRFPLPEMEGCLGAVVFSPDGKKTWASVFADVYKRTKKNPEWTPINAETGGYSLIDDISISPKRDDLWLNEYGDGLLRIKLKTGEVSQYVKNDYRRHKVKNHLPLAGDYVKTLAFTQDGRYAIVSAGSAGEDGLTVIDLETGKPTNFCVKETIEKIVVAPDNRTAWCIFSDCLLWAFDIEKKEWTHKFAPGKGLPVTYFRNLLVTPDGDYLWIRGPYGGGVYSFAKGEWKYLVNDEWEQPVPHATPMVISANGKYVVTGHTRGIAIISTDGKKLEILTLAEGVSGCKVSQIVPVPGSHDFICGIQHLDTGGIYRIDMEAMKLVEIKKLKATRISAMGIGLRGHLWAAIPGGIFEISLE